MAMRYHQPTLPPAALPAVPCDQGEAGPRDVRASGWQVTSHQMLVHLKCCFGTRFLANRPLGKDPDAG